MPLPKITEQQVAGGDLSQASCGHFWDRTELALPRPLACYIIHEPDIPAGVNIQEEHFKSTLLL